MGNSYTNITLLGPQHDGVLSVLNDMRRRAYVSPTVNGKTIVYDKASDELDIEVLGHAAAELSSRLACSALAALIFDDDVLYLQLFEDSTQTVNYVSRGGPHAGARTLCRVFSRQINLPFLWLVMQIPFVLFEYWRHSVIAKLLGIPIWAVATGYDYIQQGEFPPELSEDDLDHTPN